MLAVSLLFTARQFSTRCRPTRLFLLRRLTFYDNAMATEPKTADSTAACAEVGNAEADDELDELDDVEDDDKTEAAGNSSVCCCVEQDRDNNPGF